MRDCQRSGEALPPTAVAPASCTAACSADRALQELRARFAKADTDGDGALSRGEARAMPRISSHFEEIDANRDGKVGMEEAGHYLAAQRGQ